MAWQPKPSQWFVIAIAFVLAFVFVSDAPYFGRALAQAVFILLGGGLFVWFLEGKPRRPKPTESSQLAQWATTLAPDKPSPVAQPAPARRGYGMALAITVGAVMFLVVGSCPSMVEDFRRGYEEGRRGGGAESNVAAPVGRSNAPVAEPASRSYFYSSPDGRQLTVTISDNTQPTDELLETMFSRLFENVGPGQSAEFRFSLNGRTYSGEASRSESLPLTSQQRDLRPGENWSSNPQNAARSREFLERGPRSVQLPGNSTVEEIRPAAPLTTPERLASHYRIEIDAAHPDYPRQALQEQVQGAVSLDVTVGPDGTVSNIEVLESIPMLEQAAINIVRTSNFEYYLIRDTSVIVPTTVAF